MGAIVAAVMGLITYNRAKRREAAQWLYEVFQKFQLAPEFDQAKKILDFRYREVVEPLHAALVASGNAAILSHEEETCHQIDRILNYLEHLLYLSDSNLVEWSDCSAYFQYWFDLILQPERGVLRRYLVRFGYDRLSRYARASKDEYLLLYGSLCRNQKDHETLGLNYALEFIDECILKGALYDLGEYPGLVPGDREVKAELYRVKDISVLSRLDEFEECDRMKPTESRYRRTTVQVDCKHYYEKVDAWIFFYNRAVVYKTLVNKPSWLEYKTERDAK